MPERLRFLAEYLIELSIPLFFISVIVFGLAFIYKPNYSLYILFIPIVLPSIAIIILVVDLILEIFYMRSDSNE